jgi:hypothetical protein
VVLVDLDVQVHAVVGDHDDRLRAERAERRTVAGTALGDDAPALGDPDRGAGRGHADGAGCDREDLAGGAHAVPPLT